jgi:hypothetical protein
MTIHQSAYGESQGNPNLEVLQYLKDNWGAAEISAAIRVAKASVVPSGGNITVDIPVGAEIIDAVVQCTASNGSGSITLKTDASSPVTISDAIACVTLDNVARMGTIDQTYKIVSADGVIAVPNGDDDSGDIYVTYKK